MPKAAKSARSKRAGAVATAVKVEYSEYPSPPSTSTDPELESVQPPHKSNSSSSDEEITLEPHGLRPVKTTIANHRVYLFFRFCAERHRMWAKREAGVPRNQTSDDETMKMTFVGNIFRELDRGSKRMKEHVVDVGDQSHEETCFRIFLFCGFHSGSTWEALVNGLGEVPSWKTFDLEKYEHILHQRSIVQQQKIYDCGFQLVPPTVYFGRTTPLPHYAATLRFVMSLMEMGMHNKILDCKYATDAGAILQTVPTLGPFLSLCLLCYLNTSSHLNLSYRNYASCGPGSRGFLQRIFGRSVINSTAMEEAGLKWLYTNQWR